MREKLRFGIMLNGDRLAAWQLRSIQLLVESGLAEPAVLICNDAPPVQLSFLQKLRTYPWKHFIYRAWKRYRLHIPAQQEQPLPEYLQILPVLNCRTVHKGKFSEYFAADDLDAIRSHNLDFILRYGFNIIRGDVLNVPRYGVWSYHHGDERTFRGGPTGFWEIYRGSSANGVVLQQLNNLVDAGVILCRRNYQTVLHSYAEHLEKILAHNSDMPLEVCKKIMQGDEQPFRQEHSDTRAAINRVPGNAKMLIFLGKLVRNRIRFHYHRLFRQEQWLIGAGKLNAAIHSVAEIADLAKQPTWLPLRSTGRYGADPFVFTSGDTWQVVFENYDYREKKGIIDRVELDASLHIISSSAALESASHLAYPYIFRHADAVYMMPESAEENALRLYSWDETKKEFHLLCTLLELPAVDASMVYHEGRWWIFCGLKNDLPNEKLHIFYSDALTGPFVPHTLNPVKVTPAGARMAGNFIQTTEGLFRPGQYSCKWYGEKIVYWKIHALTAEKFEEEEAFLLEPGAGWPFRDGVHTFSADGGIFVLDAKKRKSDRISLRSSLRR